MNIFRFQEGDRFTLHGDTNPVPQYLIDAIARNRYVTSGNGLNNEAYSRTVLDQILLSCIYEENIASRNGSGEGSAMSYPKSVDWLPLIDEPARLELLHETLLSKTVMFKGEERTLSGFPDYTLHYESRSKDAFGTNLIIVEAKKTGFADGVLAQLISYLGIVSETRREQGKANAVVYGIVTDGDSFRFCRVNNDGEFSRSRFLDWPMKGHKELIFSTIRMIAREAALSSPSTTPVKDPARRQLVLTAFGRPGVEIDHGIELFEIGEDDDDNYIILGGEVTGVEGSGIRGARRQR